MFSLFFLPTSHPSTSFLRLSPPLCVTVSVSLSYPGSSHPYFASVAAAASSSKWSQQGSGGLVEAGCGGAGSGGWGSFA